MRTQGLFHEYTTCADFEKELYRHLDVKVRELLNGQFPVPSSVEERSKALKGTRSPERIDQGQPQPIDFGATLEDIAKGFSARMDTFDGPATGDKFLNMGAHVYRSCARCLDRFLAYSAGSMADQDRRVIERISSRLKLLAANPSGYLPLNFDQFWNEGREISNELAAHAAYLKRMGAY